MPEKSSSGGWKWLLIIVVIGAAAGGFFYFRHSRAETATYNTAEVARGELLQLVTASGTLNPVKNVQVGCQVSGRISKMYVDFNSVVTQGQVIAEIDPTTYLATVQSVEADLSNANANLELQQAQAKRASDLFANKLIANSDYDIAVATLHGAESTVKIKQASLENAKANLGYCKILSPVDGVVILRAVDVGQTVASSFSTPTLFQIANDLTKMQIDTSLSEADIGNIKEGQVVDFTVDAYPYRTFHGSVIQVRNSPTTLNNVVTYDTVIGVTNADYKLKPGMTANVSIVIAQREAALKISNAALRFRPSEDESPQTNAVVAATGPRSGAGGQGGSGMRGQGMRGGGGPGGGGPGMRQRGGPSNVHTVYLLAADDSAHESKLQPVQIKTGISDGIFTEVLEGLKEGDKVVTGSTSVNEAPTAPAGANPFGGGFPRRR